MHTHNNNDSKEALNQHNLNATLSNISDAELAINVDYTSLNESDSKFAEEEKRSATPEAPRIPSTYRLMVDSCKEECSWWKFAFVASWMGGAAIISASVAYYLGWNAGAKDQYNNDFKNYIGWCADPLDGNEVNNTIINGEVYQTRETYKDLCGDGPLANYHQRSIIQHKDDRWWTVSPLYVESDAQARELATQALNNDKLNYKNGVCYVVKFARGNKMKTGTACLYGDDRSVKDKKATYLSNCGRPAISVLDTKPECFEANSKFQKKPNTQLRQAFQFFNASNSEDEASLNELMNSDFAKQSSHTRRQNRG